MSDSENIIVKRIVKKPTRTIPHRNGRMMDFAPRRNNHVHTQEPVVQPRVIVEETIEERVIETTPKVVPPGYTTPVQSKSQPEPKPKPAKKSPEYRPTPFLSSVSVEKRPLSPEGIARPTYIPSEPNIYDEESEKKSAHKPKKTIPKTEVVLHKHTKKQSKALMVFLTIATVIVGVALGALVYFAIFKQQ